MKTITLQLNHAGDQWEILREGFSGQLGDPNGILPCPDWSVTQDIDGMMKTLRQFNPGASVQVGLMDMARACRAAKKARA